MSTPFLFFEFDSSLFQKYYGSGINTPGIYAIPEDETEPAAPQQGTGAVASGQLNGQKPASRSGVDFSAQDNLKNFNIGGSFTPNQNQSKPSPFGSRK